MTVDSETGTGVVKYYNDEKGFGFITPDGDPRGGDLFVHYSAVTKDPARDRPLLAVGERVEFEIEEGPKGLRANYVTVIAP